MPFAIQKEEIGLRDSHSTASGSCNLYSYLFLGHFDNKAAMDGLVRSTLRASRSLDGCCVERQLPAQQAETPDCGWG